MSTSKQATHPSTSNFTSIFDAAAKEYKKLTKKDLHTHPFAAQFHKCDTPHVVLDVFRKQAQDFEEFRKGDDRLIKWLDPTVNYMFGSDCGSTFISGIPREIRFFPCRYFLIPPSQPFSPAKTIFTAIGFLLNAAKDVIASHNILVNLFERVQFFLQRLKIYNGIPLTTEMTELFGKIMAQVLFILALSTKEMSQRRIKKYVKNLLGLRRTDVQDALQRLDMLTKEESAMGIARNLEVTHDVD
ncbi:hypothetical protein BJV78DRAFT_1352556 [Lactifluus subvellereus]|nr:hypothetical protein BJV78DRAFT_1352556 [Lactifluus subvellereus]